MSESVKIKFKCKVSTPETEDSDLADGEIEFSDGEVLLIRVAWITGESLAIIPLSPIAEQLALAANPRQEALL